MKKQRSNLGIGIIDWFILGFTLSFLNAKLWGKINWSWWWVLSPLWMPIGIMILILIVAVIVTLIETN